MPILLALVAVLFMAGCEDQAEPCGLTSSCVEGFTCFDNSDCASGRCDGRDGCAAPCESDSDCEDSTCAAPDGGTGACR